MPPEPGGKPFDPDEGPHGDPENAGPDPAEQQRARDFAKDLIREHFKKDSTATVRDAIKLLMKNAKDSLTALTSDINKVFKKEPNKAQHVKDWFQNFLTDYSSIKDALDGDKPITLDFLNETKNPEQAAAVKEYAQIKGKSMLEVMKNSIDDLNGKIKKAGFNIPEGTNWTELLNSLTEQLGRIDDFTNEHVTPEAEKTFEDNKIKALLEQVKSGKIKDIEGKPTWTDGLKKSLKWLILLLLMGGSLLLFAKWLVSYSEAHSGCQLISMKVNEMPVSTPYKCWGHGGAGSDIDVLNSGKSFANFNLGQCTCGSTTEKDPKGSKCENSCSETACKSPGPGDTCLTPHPQNPNCKGLPCSGDYSSFKAPYKYYYWGVMTPLDSLGNMGNGIVNGAHNTFKWLVDLIIKIAIWLGAIIGVLLVLWIIYKVVANRKPAETLKIQEVAPGASQFGKGFLGNLSKYNNYANMGRCTTFNSRPYMPTRFNIPNYKF